MLERYELFGAPQDRYGNPAPLGLLGLAIACAALVPIAFGHSLTASGLATAAVYALLFGAGCQFLCGLMLFGNKNGFGGTVFTCFSFQWLNTAYGFWSLSQGKVPDHGVSLSVEIVLLVIFLGLTWGFGHFGRALFIFLLDIDLLFVARIIRSVTHTKAMEMPIAITTVGLGAIGLYLALGGLLNPVLGRVVFPIGPPLFFAPKKPGFDWSTRRNIFQALYDAWRAQGFRLVPIADLESKVAAAGVKGDLGPDLFYLAELGFVVLQTKEGDPHVITNVRLHAKGVDIHEQLVLGKYTPAAGAAH